MCWWKGCCGLWLHKLGPGTDLVLAFPYSLPGSVRQKGAGQILVLVEKIEMLKKSVRGVHTAASLPHKFKSDVIDGLPDILHITDSFIMFFAKGIRTSLP